MSRTASLETVNRGERSCVHPTPKMIDPILFSISAGNPCLRPSAHFPESAVLKNPGKISARQTEGKKPADPYGSAGASLISQTGSSDLTLMILIT